MRCRVCGSLCRHFETVNDVFYRGDRCLLKASDTAPPQRGDLTLYQCSHCGHVQAEYLLPEDFYDCYSEQGGSNQYAPSLDFTEKKLQKLRHYTGSGRRLVDIGCGVGHALTIAGSFFDDCLGIEPSYNTYCMAKNHGLNVVNAYFSRELQMETPISAFAAFQVFEHLTDIYAVLDYAYEVLEPGGVGLINVPNGQEIIHHALYHQLTFEHVNYFNAYSIGLMAHRAGFEIIEIEDVPETIELDLYVRKPCPHMSFGSAKERQRERLQEMLASYPSISVYGAGAKSSYFAMLLPESVTVSHVFDSSPSKIGAHIPGLAPAVEAADMAVISQEPAVIIFASSYNSEIINRLREGGYPGDILYFDNVDVKKD